MHGLLNFKYCGFNSGAEGLRAFLQFYLKIILPHEHRVVTFVLQAIKVLGNHHLMQYYKTFSPQLTDLFLKMDLRESY
jgi:hypothetical protein